MGTRTKSPALEKASRTGHPKFRILTQSGRTGVVLECGAEKILWNAKGRATHPKLTPEELAMMNEPKAAGNEVEQLPRITGKKTADFLVNGVRTDLKTVTGSSPTTIKSAIEAAAK
jgi:hypothetical protein